MTKNFKFFVCFSLIFVILVSVFSVSSFAYSVPGFESDDQSSVSLPNSYFYFEPSLVLSHWPDYPIQEVFIADFPFSSYDDPSLTFDGISLVYRNGVLTASYLKSPSSVVVWTYDGSNFDFVRRDLMHIYVPGGYGTRSGFVALRSFFVPAARPGWYSFDPSSPFLGSSNFTIPFFSPNDPEYSPLPSLLYGRIRDNWPTGSPDSVDFVISAFYYEYYGNPNYEKDIYSLRFGFASDSPGTLVWNGRLYLQHPAFFNSYDQYNAFTSLFYLEGSDADPNLSYSDGYSAGYNEGYDSGYFVGNGEGRVEGYDTGLSVGYDQGYSEGYDLGYDDGVNVSGSASFGKNLLGETLSAPFNAFMNIQLFTLPNGDPFTLGTIFATLVSLIIFIIFLRMFAGG